MDVMIYVTRTASASRQSADRHAGELTHTYIYIHTLTSYILYSIYILLHLLLTSYILYYIYSHHTSYIIYTYYCIYSILYMYLYTYQYTCNLPRRPDSRRTCGGSGGRGGCRRSPVDVDVTVVVYFYFLGGVRVFIGLFIYV